MEHFVDFAIPPLAISAHEFPDAFGGDYHSFRCQGFQVVLGADSCRILGLFQEILGILADDFQVVGRIVTNVFQLLLRDCG